MTRSNRRKRDRQSRLLQIRRARKEDREIVWQIFHAVVAGGDTYVFDPNISRRKALAYWLGPKTRCYVALSDQGIVGSYILKANQPGLGSHVANAGFMVSPSARGRGIGRAMAEHFCSKLTVSVFGRCNSTLSSRPTELRCVFGKILDLKSSANCQALSAIAGVGLLMFL